MDKRLEELSKVDGLDQFLVHQPADGFFDSRNTLYNSEPFKK